MKRMLVSQRNIYMVAAIALFMVVLLVTAACTAVSTSTAVITSTPEITSTLNSTAPTIIQISPSASTSTPSSALAYTINTNSKTGVGTYLVDGKGMTLYWTTRDSVGMSNITGATLANWPVFYSSNVIVPSPLNTSDFSSIIRNDGSMQTTFKGWPLLLLC